MPLDADEEGRALTAAAGAGNVVFTGQKSTAGNPIVRLLPKGKGNRVCHFDTCPAKARKR